MTKGSLQHKETLLLEALLSGLDARESARAAKTPMLVYLADLLIQRAREELEAVRISLDVPADEQHKGDAAA